MEFKYPENQEWTTTQEILEAKGMSKRESARLTSYKISNLRSCAMVSEKTAARMADRKRDQETVDGWTKRAVRFQERANELQAYLDERMSSN